MIDHYAVTHAGSERDCTGRPRTCADSTPPELIAVPIKSGSRFGCLSLVSGCWFPRISVRGSSEQLCDTLRERMACDTGGVYE